MREWFLGARSPASNTGAIARDRGLVGKPDRPTRILRASASLKNDIDARMATIQWGTEEHLECIAYTPGLREELGPGVLEGQQPCLGFKFSVSWLGLPYWVSDDGYVLATEGGKQYIQLDPAMIQELQASSRLPTPLPAYQLPLEWRIGGFSLWIVIGLAAIASAVSVARRRRLARALQPRAITTSGPVIARAGDRAIREALRSTLEPGETITHQGLARERVSPRKEHMVALTDRRLLVRTTRIGLFGLGKGKPSITATARDQITGIYADGVTLYVERRDLPTLTLPVSLFDRRFTHANQLALLADLPRLIARSPDDAAV